MTEKPTVEMEPVSGKRPWSAPRIILATAAADSQNTVPFPGVDHYEAYFPSAGS
jgi:hypothetical protein